MTVLREAAQSVGPDQKMRKRSAVLLCLCLERRCRSITIAAHQRKESVLILTYVHEKKDVLMFYSWYYTVVNGA